MTIEILLQDIGTYLFISQNCTNIWLLLSVANVPLPLFQLVPALVLLSLAAATPRKTYKREGKPPPDHSTNTDMPLS